MKDPCSKNWGSLNLQKLSSAIHSCTRCPLSNTRIYAVPGSGPEDAQLVLIGEGPGSEEDMKGQPFVGRVGQSLRGMLVEVGLDLNTVFFTNLIKCLPTDGVTNSRGSFQFRQPKQLEIVECHPYLQAQLDIIGPKVVIPLGLVPTNEWFPGTTMGESHGVLRHTGQFLLSPTYHPSIVARGAVHLREVIVADIRRACEMGGILKTKTGGL